MGMPRGRKPAAATRLTRRRIQRAAARAFAAGGYAAATMDAVAAAAGCGKGTLYFHFPSKEALLLAVIDDVASMLDAALSAALAGPRPAGACAAAVTGLVAALAAQPAGARVWLLEAPAAGAAPRARLAAAVARLRRGLREAVAQPVARRREGPADAAALADLCLNTAEGVVRSWLLEGAPGSGPLPAAADAAAALAARAAGDRGPPFRAASGASALPLPWPTW